MVVIWSDYAKQDLKSYYKNSNIVTPGKVEKYNNELVEYADTLSSSPELGKEFLSYHNVMIRQLLFQMHRIFYFIDNGEIIIIQVSHYSRSLDNIIKTIKKYFND